jgi:hypothetical protein
MVQVKGFSYYTPRRRGDEAKAIASSHPCVFASTIVGLMKLGGDRMLSFSISGSRWKQISARLLDLLALALGTTISSALLLWRQHPGAVPSSGYLIGGVVFFLFAIMGYSLGILASMLQQRITELHAGGDTSTRHHIHPAGVVQLWRWMLLFLLLFHIGWVLLPVAWSGLRCVENMCESATAIPLHTEEFLAYETRYTLILLLFFLIYGIVLPLGTSLAIRICLAPHWLGRRLTFYWIGGAILLNIALIFTFPLVDWLGAWYE